MLRFLATRTEPTAAATIARELKLPRASTYRILRALSDAGFATHFIDDGSWGLGIGAFEIGTAYLRQGPLERLARPQLQKLALKLHVTAQFGVLHGTDFLYLVKESTPRATPLVTDVGVRLPASLTASGRAVLAALPAKQRAALYPRDYVYPNRTGRGPQTGRELNALLAAEAERGWSAEDGEVTVGLASVSAAVIGPDGWPTGAVGVTFARDRWTDLSQPAQAVVLTADRLSRRLGPGN